MSFNYSASGLIQLGVLFVTMFTYVSVSFALSASNTVKEQTNADKKLVGQMTTITTLTMISAIILTLKLVYETVLSK